MSETSRSWVDWVRAATQASTWLGLVLIAGLWAALTFHIEAEREQTGEAWTRNTRNLARAFEEHTLRAVREVDKIVLLLRTALEKNPEEFDLVAFTASPYFRNELTLQMAIIGASGRLVATNVVGAATGVDLSDREHFRVHVDSPDDTLFISRPVLGRASGKWSIQLTRKIRRPDGSFGGVLVASLDPETFTSFYESIELGEGGTITVLGEDGIIRARGGAGGELGRSVAGSPVLAAAKVKGAGTLSVNSARDGQERLVSYRTVRGYPLVVTVSVPKSEITARITAKEAQLRGLAQLATLLVLGAIGFSLRNRLRLDRTRRELAQSQARTSMKSHELEATLDNMSQGIMMVDAHSVVAVINRRAVELLDLPERFLSSRPLFHEIRDWQWAQGEFAPETASPDIVNFVRAGGISREIQVYERRRPNGTVLEVRSIPLAGGGMVRTFTDITERVKAKETLAKARDAAEAASRTRTAFLAMMSHEMRTPLNGVIGMASLLLDTPLNGEQKRYTATLRESADHLLQIINDVLDLAKMEADRLKLEDVPFDMRELAGSVVQMLAPNAQAKGLFIAAMIAPDVPRLLRGDPAVLRQILINLVGNGVKFTENGFVTVEISREDASDDTGAALLIEVRDSGIGMAEDKLPALFQEFSQLDGSISRRFGGTGLGLAICRKIVERLGGRIGVESTPDVGSVFRVRLTLPVEDAAPAQRSLDGLDVAVVSPHPMARTVLSSLLEDQGASVTEAADPARAVVLAAHPSCKAVLVDDSIGELDMLLASLRELPAPRPRIVRISGIGVLRNGRGDPREGADAGLAWPAQAQTIADILLGTDPGEGAADPDGAAQPGPGFRILMAEDNRTNRLVIGTILEKMGHVVHAVTNGAEAVAAVQQTEYDLVLMDVMMPEMDGYAATRAIRALPGPAARVPIVALTANALTEDESAARAAGMDDFATKPITAPKLGMIIRRICGEPPLAVPPEAPARDDAAAAFDQQVYRRFAEEIGADLAGEIVEVFLRDTRERLQTMTATAGDRRQLSREAHALKSAAATFGLMQMSHLAAVLEKEAEAMSAEAACERVDDLNAAFEAAGPKLRELTHG